MIKLVSVNAFNLYGNAAEVARFEHVEEMIRRAGADIVAVQEVVAPLPKSVGDVDQRVLAQRRVRKLADAVGLRCDTDGEVMFALGGGIHHTALLWRDGITPGNVEIAPVKGTIGRFEREPAGMWHSLVTAVFDLGGPKLRVGSVQLSPFDPGRGWGWSDAGQVMRAMNSEAIPGVIGGDWNGLGSTKVVLLDGGEAFYDPDPYSGLDWHPDHAYQLDEHGQVDRSAARRLEGPGPGRFRDCARITDAAWAATTGHPDDHHPPRRIDRWYATYHAPDAAITGYGVAGPDAFACTDHLPVWITIDESRLAG